MVRNLTLTGATLVALLTGAIPITGCDGVNPIGGGPGVNSNEVVLTNTGCNISMRIHRDGTVDFASKYSAEPWDREYLVNAGEFNGDFSSLDGSVYIPNNEELEPSWLAVVGTRHLIPGRELSPEDNEYFNNGCINGGTYGDAQNEILGEFGGVLVDHVELPGNLYPYIIAPEPWAGRDNCKERPYYIQNLCEQ